VRINKLIKLSLKEAKYDTRFPNKLIGCPNSSSTMASKEIKQTYKGTLWCQQKYINELLKWVNILEVKTMLNRGNFIMKFCKMEDQVAGIFTKALRKDQLHTVIGT